MRSRNFVHVLGIFVMAVLSATSTSTILAERALAQDNDVSLDGTLMWLKDKIGEYCHREVSSYTTSWSLIGWNGTVITLEEIGLYESGNYKNKTINTYEVDLADLDPAKISLMTVTADEPIWLSTIDDAYKIKRTTRKEALDNFYRPEDFNTVKNTRSRVIQLCTDGNRQMGERMIQALKHAATLCQRPRTKEPF